MNTHLQPHLDTDNIKHPKSWPWLYDQLHPPTPDTTPRLHDLFRSQNPHLRQWTRPRNKRLPDSQSRIDLIIASSSFISIFNPQNTFIHTTINNSDHYPVTSTINIPTNPLNIYDIPHADIYYRKLNKEEHSKFLQRLHSLDTWTQNNMTSILNSPIDELIDTTNNIPCSLVNSYKLVTNQHHSHKPTNIEKAFTHQLNNIQPSTTLTSKQAKTLEHTLDKWTEKKKRQSQKRLHHSLIKGRKIKKSLNNILTPRSTTPMALYDTNNNLTSDPYSLCESMGQCLTALGGPPDFQIEPQLIDSLMELSPSIPQDAPHPEFTEIFFNTLLSNSNPVKAPGFDNTNLYLFHLAPKHIKSLLFHVCSHFITNLIPKQWLTARIFLLYKKHDPHNPINYRPIALLQTIYKILASYAATALTFYATKYNLLHHSQYGGIPNHRTTDHIFTMISNISLHPDIYHLYLDLNKAFNSVPHQALWQILHNYNFPKHIISLIQNLYSHPADYPTVNGFSLFAAMTIRGLRQGCPMSPILFNLFIDPIIRKLSSLLPSHTFSALFSFIDDIALQTACPKILHTALSFLFNVGPKYGLSFNATKSELHALNNAPHLTIRISSTTHFSTFDQHGKQRQYYKYLGVFFFTSQQNQQMFLLLKNLVNSFFTNLLPLSLSHTELIKLSNIQLIPILAYRLIYNSLINKLLDTLDHSIWLNIASQGKLSLRTPNKTKYSPRHTLGLGITKISHVTHTQAINHFLRYTSNEGPPTSNRSIQHTLFHRGPVSNLLQDMLITSAHHFSIQTHNIPHHNPCQVRSLPLNSAIQVAFLDHNNENSNLWFPGTTIQHNLHSTSVQFSDNIFHLHDTHHFSFITQKGNELSSFITTPTHPICPTTLQDFPISHTTTLSTTHYFQLKSNQNIPLPNFSHLDYWGCHDLLNALQSNTTYSIIYTDGSDDPNSSNPSGSAAIISLQPNDHTIITSPSPLKGSYPAEIYAIIISLLYPQLTTLPQPIIFAIDNLSTCLTLNTLLHFHSPPFTTSNNAFALWYNLIWHLLQHLKHIAILFAWIKGHANFPGNDAADSVSKWSTTHFDYLLSPTTSTQLAINQTPLPGKITSKLTKHQLPTHQHNNIHLSLSNHFFLKSSWFSTFTFKWVDGLFSCKGYQPHFILNTYLCPLCNHHHPLDPITFITECHTTNAIRKKFFNTWNGHFHNTIITWWATASKGDRRNFIRTLIPNTLSNQLRTPPPNTTYYSNIKSLRQALKHRQKPLTTLLNETKQWLIDNPISNLHQLSPTSTSNPWNESFSIYSTSSTAPHPLRFPSPTNKEPTNKRPHSKRPTTKPKPPTKTSAIQLQHFPPQPLHPHITNRIPPPNDT